MKDMSKHTPGPWKISPIAEDPIKERNLITNESGQMFICKILRNDADEQTNANSLLISQAPELLEAYNTLVASHRELLSALEMVQRAFGKEAVHEQLSDIESTILQTALLNAKSLNS